MGFRLVWYATASAVLAGGVVLSAFHQRPNFYSACVYLAQSNLCLMILINLILLFYGTFMYSLQRICYGALRPIEIEQLYEKGWFAVTETCLAMTIFREEVGAWFLLMFVALLTGKVWGWIGDGRVEILGQQPPANPRLVHIRLSTSLAMSVIYDLAMMNYIINAVIQQARPNMMVMFLFEFAILATTSLSTACRYGISLIEANIVKKQTQERLLERRRELREQRLERMRHEDASTENDSLQPDASLAAEEDIDEMDIEVPGWEAKGHWVLTLDLVTDFVKFGIYTSFFIVLLMFYGIPIHIVRDLLLTARSCMKRLAAFLRYRRATRDMNERYPDATTEDIQREDTCIICREEMRPWSAIHPQLPVAEDGDPPARPAPLVNERMRPKKLPCGHILHLGCLKSWLERQQVCPTCRRPVVDAQSQPPRLPNAIPGQGRPAQLPDQHDGAGGQQPAAGRVPVRGMRMINLGPLRVVFGQANFQDIARELGGPQGNPENAGANAPRVYGLELGFPRRAQPQRPAPGTIDAPSGSSLQEQLQAMEAQILGELHALRLTQQEWQVTNLLRAELDRIRAIRNGAADPLAGNIQAPQVPPQFTQLPTRTFNPPVPHVQVFQPGTTSVIPSGHTDLPPGVTIPDGWSLLPLENIDINDETTQNLVSSPGSSRNSHPVERSPNMDTNHNNFHASFSETREANELNSQSLETSIPGLGSHTSTTDVTPYQTSSPTKEEVKKSSTSLDEEKNDKFFDSGSSSFPGFIRKTCVQSGPNPHPSTSTSSNLSGAEPSTQDKGKSRAATVEDMIDESET